MNNLSAERIVLLTLGKQAKRCLGIPAFIGTSKLMNGKILIIKDAFVILILSGKNTYNAISKHKKRSPEGRFGLLAGSKSHVGNALHINNHNESRRKQISGSAELS